MTEPFIRDLLAVIESERDGRLAHARQAEEIAALFDLIRNDLAEWRLAASRGIPIPEKAIDDVRTRIANGVEAIVQLGSEAASSCAALSRRLPPQPQGESGEPRPVDPNADTLDMALDEIAASDD